MEHNKCSKQRNGKRWQKKKRSARKETPSVIRERITIPRLGLQMRDGEINSSPSDNVGMSVHSVINHIVMT